MAQQTFMQTMGGPPQLSNGMGGLQNSRPIHSMNPNLKPGPRGPTNYAYTQMPGPRQATMGPTTLQQDYPRVMPQQQPNRHEQSQSVASTVTHRFVHAYYDKLSTKPADLYTLYDPEHSVMNHLEHGKPYNIQDCVYSADSIREYFSKFKYPQATIRVEFADFQANTDSMIIICVHGHIKRMGMDAEQRRFIQTFVLSQNQHRYYVILNDVFRFMEPQTTQQRFNEPAQNELGQYANQVHQQRGPQMNQDFQRNPAQQQLPGGSQASPQGAAPETQYNDAQTSRLPNANRQAASPASHGPGPASLQQQANQQGPRDSPQQQEQSQAGGNAGRGYEQQQPRRPPISGQASPDQTQAASRRGPPPGVAQQSSQPQPAEPAQEPVVEPTTSTQRPRTPAESPELAPQQAAPPPAAEPDEPPEPEEPPAPKGPKSWAGLAKNLTAGANGDANMKDMRPVKREPTPKNDSPEREQRGKDDRRTRGQRNVRGRDNSSPRNRGGRGRGRGGYRGRGRGSPRNQSGTNSADPDQKGYRGRKQPRKNGVFVNNWDETTVPDEQAVREALEKSYGPITHADIRSTFGFVYFDKAEDQKKACDAGEIEVGNQTIKMCPKREPGPNYNNRGNRNGRGGGRGRGRGGRGGRGNRSGRGYKGRGGGRGGPRRAAETPSRRNDNAPQRNDNAPQRNDNAPQRNDNAPQTA